MRAVYRNPKELATKLKDVIDLYLEDLLSYEKLERLCDLTGYSADYILFGKDNRIRRETKQVLSGFNDRQIQQACGIISQIATFIKNSDIA